MLKDEIEKKYQLKKTKKLELIHQTHEMGYETELTTYKVNHNKLRKEIYI